MSIKRIDDFVIFAPEPERLCEECGKLADCRPYGLNGMNVCCECALLPKHAAEVRRRMNAALEKAIKGGLH